MISQLLFNSSWSPANISTVFWYDAADSSTITAGGSEVVQVLDKSGNNRNLLRASGQTGPLTGTRTLNGLNVFEWTGSNCLENATFTYNQAVTPLNIAIVTHVDDLTSADDSADQHFFIAGSKIVNPQGFRMSARVNVSNSGSGLTVLGGDGVNNVNMNASVALTRNQPNIIIIKFNAASSAWKVNGGSPSVGNVGTNSFSILSWGHNEVEQSDLDGFIGEMIGFSDNTKQEIVEGYLAWKWGIVNNLPEAHPYKNTAPRL
jgi:hypothetical protein